MKGHRRQMSRSVASYPECPDCGTDMPVVGLPGEATPDYECLRCGQLFEREAPA